MSAMASDTIERQLRDLGVRQGGVLLVHTSFRAVGPVEGGPLGLVRALRGALGPAGTLVMPTMTDGATVFDPRSTPTHEMGITAELFWRQPGVLRSDHPGGSFAAEGRLGARIVAPQPLSPPHGPDSPVGRVHDLDGQVLLLGVAHSESTTVAGRRDMGHLLNGAISDCQRPDFLLPTVRGGHSSGVGSARAAGAVAASRLRRNRPYSSFMGSSRSTLTRRRVEKTARPSLGLYPSFW